MDITVTRNSPTGQAMAADAEAAVSEALCDLAFWLYRQLENEYDWLTSDTAVDEALLINEYTFTEAGLRAGLPEDFIVSDKLHETNYPDDHNDRLWWGLLCTVTPCFGARLVAGVARKPRQLNIARLAEVCLWLTADGLWLYVVGI